MTSDDLLTPRNPKNLHRPRRAEAPAHGSGRLGFAGGQSAPSAAATKLEAGPEALAQELKLGRAL